MRYALSDQTKLQRTAHVDALIISQFCKQCGGAFIRMRTTCNHLDRLAGYMRFDLYGMSLSRAVPNKGSHATRREITNFQNRRIHNAQHRLTSLNQRDIDGKFAIVLDELLGAIKRINQPETLPVTAFRIRDLRRPLQRAAANLDSILSVRC